ncbi:hypothetical protein H920_13379 [Fukomys damarensis]|uniref:Uncharacterized protein n=1 Tax=Fukomys damarensis TaxID=885580 RepID=A0A091D3V7_FUKDA|nr:hypothetical protein H920_13379 [Fukomys damarensis]
MREKRKKTIVIKERRVDGARDENVGKGDDGLDKDNDEGGKDDDGLDFFTGSELFKVAYHAPNPLERGKNERDAHSALSELPGQEIKQNRK